MNEQQSMDKQTESGRTAVWATGALLVAAVLASACCIGPFVLAVFGTSVLGVSAAFEQVRPVFLGVTVLAYIPEWVRGKDVMRASVHQG